MAQLTVKNFRLITEDFENVFCDSKRRSITCLLSEHVSLILKRTKRDTVIIIEKDKKKRIVLPI